MSSEQAPVSGLPPVPEQPSFPVYGLAASFPGRRWLDVWNRLHSGLPNNPIWHIDLGHGDDPAEPSLVTITDAKLPQYRTGSGGWGGPTGVADAARKALVGMIQLAYPATSAGVRPAGFREEVKRAMEIAGDRTGPEWSTASAVVDDATVTFHMSTRNDAWAAVTDLGEVAVGAFGRDLRLSDYPLVAVPDLSNYPSPTPQR